VGKLVDSLKKKGFKIPILRIPTRKTPQQIDHNIRTEFDRARVIRTLSRTLEFLDDIERLDIYENRSRLWGMTSEIGALLRELKSYQK
jgi:hypothetical protein